MRTGTSIPGFLMGEKSGRTKSISSKEEESGAADIIGKEAQATDDPARHTRD